MSSIVDVFLHGLVHLTNPGLEELLADTLSQGTLHSRVAPRGPADLPGIARQASPPRRCETSVTSHALRDYRYLPGAATLLGALR